MAKFPNQFLEELRKSADLDLRPLCEEVELPSGTLLYEYPDRPRYVHFLTSGMASVVNTMLSGSAVEVGMYGYEGFPEAIYLLGPLSSQRRCLMQVSGSGLRMSFTAVEKEFEQNAAVRKLALRLALFENLSLAQMTACNGLHEVEDRLARWLLMVQDRLGEDHLPLTQEFLGEMLGTRRASVTLSAGNLQRAGLIRYQRGRVTVKRREDLEQVACECYGVLTRLRSSVFD